MPPPKKVSPPYNMLPASYDLTINTSVSPQTMARLQNLTAFYGFDFDEQTLSHIITAMFRSVYGDDPEWHPYEPSREEQAEIDRHEKLRRAEARRLRDLAAGKTDVA